MLVYIVSDSNCWRLCNGIGNLDNKWLGWVQLLACGIEAYDQDTTELQNVNLCGFLLQPVLYTPFLLVRDVSFSNSVGSPAQGCYPASLFRSPPDSALSLVKVVCYFCAAIHFDNSFLFRYFLVLDWWFWMLIVRGNLVCVVSWSIIIWNTLDIRRILDDQYEMACSFVPRTEINKFLRILRFCIAWTDQRNSRGRMRSFSSGYMFQLVSDFPSTPFLHQHCTNVLRIIVGFSPCNTAILYTKILIMSISVNSNRAVIFCQK